MRFTVSSTALSAKLSALARVINSKAGLPISGDSGFEVSGNGKLRLTAQGHKGNNNTIINIINNAGNNIEIILLQIERIDNTETTISATQQSDSSYANRGHKQTYQARKAWNNAQRCHHEVHRAVFRVAWPGGYYPEVLRPEERLRCQLRLGRHRGRSDGFYQGEEKAGRGGREGAATANGSGYDSWADEPHWRAERPDAICIYPTSRYRCAKLNYYHDYTHLTRI